MSTTALGTTPPIDSNAATLSTPLLPATVFSDQAQSLDSSLGSPLKKQRAGMDSESSQLGFGSGISNVMAAAETPRSIPDVKVNAAADEEEEEL
jgi:hypothetical protein